MLRRAASRSIFRLTAQESDHCRALVEALSSADPQVSLAGVDFVPSAASLGAALSKSPSADAALQCFAWASNLPSFRHGFHAHNALLLALIRGGRHRDARSLFDSHLQSLSPHASTIGILATAHLQHRDLDAALRLLQDLPDSVTPNAATLSEVMLALCKSKRSADAVRLLRLMQKRDVVPELDSYALLIQGLGREHRVKDAFDLFQELHARGLTAEPSSYAHIICGLAKYRFVDEALELFQEMIRRGIPPIRNSIISLLNAFCQHRRIDDAVRLFRKMASEYKCAPTTLAYNILLSGLQKVDRVDDMREIFLEMKERGCQPDIVTFSTYILGLCKAGRVDDAMVVKKEMAANSCSPDSVVYSILINGLCKVGKICDAEKLLQEMLDRGLEPDLVCFGAMVESLERSGRFADALELFRKMVARGCKPDESLSSLVMDSFLRRNDVAQAVGLFDELAMRDLALPSLVSIDGLVKKVVMAKKLEDGVRALTNAVLKGRKPMQQSYLVLMKELCRKKMAVETVELVREMRAAGYPTTDLSSVMEMLSKLKMVEQAWALHQEMAKLQHFPDVATYNVLLSRLCSDGRLSDACDLFQEMIENGRIPDDTSYELLVEGLCKAGKPLEGHELFKQLTSRGSVPSVDICSMLATGLCKCLCQRVKEEDEAERRLREMIDDGYVPEDEIADVIQQVEARTRKPRKRPA